MTVTEYYLEPPTRPPSHSPWGAPQGARREEIPGVFRVSTAGHGGFWLAPARVDAIRAALPDFRPWAEYPWLEEDCDVTAAYLVFAPEFPDLAVYHAVRAARADARKGAGTCGPSCSSACAGHEYLTGAHAWLATETGKATAARADAYERTIADCWEPGSMGTSGKGWCVDFRHVTTGARRMVRMEYPDRPHYTSAELDALDLGPTPTR